jgi:hypothetical protein
MTTRFILLVACLLAGLAPTLAAQDQFLDSDAESDCNNAPIVVPAGNSGSVSCTVDGYTIFDEHYQAYSNMFANNCSTTAYLDVGWEGSQYLISSWSTGETTGGANDYDYMVTYPDGDSVSSPDDLVPC